MSRLRTGQRMGGLGVKLSAGSVGLQGRSRHKCPLLPSVRHTRRDQGDWSSGSEWWAQNWLICLSGSRLEPVRMGKPIQWVPEGGARARRLSTHHPPMSDLSSTPPYSCLSPEAQPWSQAAGGVRSQLPLHACVRGTPMVCLPHGNPCGMLSPSPWSLPRCLRAPSRAGVGRKWVTSPIRYLPLPLFSGHHAAKGLWPPLDWPAVTSHCQMPIPELE